MQPRRMKNTSRNIVIVFNYWKDQTTGFGNSTEYRIRGQLNAKSFRELESDLCLRNGFTRVVISNIIYL